MFARELRGFYLALGATFAKTTRHQDRVKTFQMRRCVFAVEQLGIDPFNLDPDPIGHTAMGQSLGDRFIGVFQLCVLAHNRHFHLTFGLMNAVADIFPLAQIRLWCGRDLERVQHRLIHPFAVIGQRRIINRTQVLRSNHAVRPYVAEQRQLFALFDRDRPFGAAHQNVWRNADRA